MTFLAELQELVECQSPTEDLEACVRVVNLAAEIVARNLSTPARVFTEKGRPVVWWGSETPKIVLLTHLDTVWPTDSYLPLWKVDGDKISGPGTFDMKAGFLQALYALKNIEGAEKGVALIATSDEEVGSQTSRELIEKVSKLIASKSSSFYIIRAPTDWGRRLETLPEAHRPRGLPRDQRRKKPPGASNNYLKFDSL